MRLMAIGGMVALGVALVLVIGFFFGKAADRAGRIVEGVTGVGDYTAYGTVTVESVRGLSELTTVEMIEYTTIEKGDDRGWLNWARGDRLTMFVVATVSAGVDLSKVEDQNLIVDRETGTVTLILPPAEITHLEVDNTKSHVYDRDTGIFRTSDKDLERTARLAAEQILRDQALEEGILQMAEDRATEVFTDILESLGYLDISVTIAS